MTAARSLRPFRFGVQLHHALTAPAWREQARRAEALGYNIALMPDHLGEQFAIGSALAAVAAATTTLRIGTLVWQNDLRHPALLAKEAATLDVLSDGRFELGIGAGGSFLPDFDWTGIPFAPAGDRVARLTESLPIIKALLAGETVSFAGRHYTITDYPGFPKSVQEPHPPIFIGGGGPRMLTLAAQHADIIGAFPAMLPAGGDFRIAEGSAAGYDRKIALIRDAAGPRFANLEFNILLQGLFITDDVVSVSEEVSRDWAPLTPAEVLDSPYLLIGSIDAIVDTLRTRRERHGISYLVVFAREMEAFAPVVARLAGT